MTVFKVLTLVRNVRMSYSLLNSAAQQEVLQCSIQRELATKENKFSQLFRLV